MRFLMLSGLLSSVLGSQQSPIATSRSGQLTTSVTKLPAMPAALRLVRGGAAAKPGIASAKVPAAAAAKAPSAFDGARTVAGGALLHLVFGTLYCWGNFQGYAPASLKKAVTPFGTDILTIMPVRPPIAQPSWHT